MRPDQREMLTAYRKGYGVQTVRELCKIAHRLSTSLGHLPVRQGESVECARCGVSGAAREVLTGAVHLEACTGGAS
jgi:hypothetical protein